MSNPFDDGPPVPAEKPRQGRKRTRRNYSKELERLQGKVDLAIVMLRKAKGDLAERIVEIAIETLGEA